MNKPHLKQGGGGGGGRYQGRWPTIREYIILRDGFAVVRGGVVVVLGQSRLFRLSDVLIFLP